MLSSYRKKLIGFVILILIVLSSCITRNDNIASSVQSNTIKMNSDIELVNEDETYIGKEKFKIYNFGLFESSKMFLIKSHHAVSQMLGVIVVNKDNELIIFDGGRIEDASFLIDFIKQFDGKVKYWFLTHIHDDHVGAIYEIFNNHTEDIYVENICYNFADFSWYYERTGDDAYMLLLFEAAKTKYIDHMTNAGKVVSVNPKIKKNDTFAIDNISVKVMNDIYLIDSDPINNSSIVYKVDVENTSMMVLGDLSYYGGDELLKDNNGVNSLKSDIVVMAHHGQAGVDYSVYEKISPKIALWPTTKNIYENQSGKFQTDETKKWMNRIGVKYNILAYPDSVIIE